MTILAAVQPLECADLPAVLYFDEHARWFRSRLEELEAVDYRRLYRCRGCGQLWRVDAWDSPIAMKIAERETWRTFAVPALPSRKSNEPCAWQGCANRAIDGMAICAEHLQ